MLLEGCRDPASHFDKQTLTWHPEFAAACLTSDLPRALVLVCGIVLLLFFTITHFKLPGQHIRLPDGEETKSENETLLLQAEAEQRRSFASSLEHPSPPPVVHLTARNASTLLFTGAAMVSGTFRQDPSPLCALIVRPSICPPQIPNLTYLNLPGTNIADACLARCGWIRHLVRQLLYGDSNCVHFHVRWILGPFE